MKNYFLQFTFVFGMVISFPGIAQKLSFEFQQINTKSSIRGLSVPDDNVIWMSGSLGTVCRSTDGSKSFNCIAVPGYDSSEFRSIYAFDANNAIICKIGSPGKILKTSDGGLTWKEVYTNNHEAIFIDGIDFWNEKEGICFGDPIDGKIFLLKTMDGGNTWQPLTGPSRPVMVDGESSFAASGTSIRCFENGKVVIATGGEISRLLISHDRGASWITKTTPILQGKPSAGIFSFDFINDSTGIIVGGDYKVDTLMMDHIFITTNGATDWRLPLHPTRGYRECVAYVTSKMVFAVGPSGIDISNDGGLSWSAFSDQKKLHVVRKARNGKLVIVAGGNGQVGKLINLKD